MKNKTAKQLLEYAKRWDLAYADECRNIEQNPDNAFSIAASQLLKKLAKNEAFRLRAKAAVLIGRK